MGGKKIIFFRLWGEIKQLFSTYKRQIRDVFQTRSESQIAVFEPARMRARKAG
jgi:hypothetical protein